MKNKIITPYLLVIPITITVLGASILSCTSKEETRRFDYGTKNDSARYYYLNGFHEILDNGRWTAAEQSFRKALEFDSNYVLGKSLVGRITRNVAEREGLQYELIKAKGNTNSDENLLLEVYLLSIEGYNQRDKGIKSSAEFNERRRLTALSNFKEFIHRHPEDYYVKAEYIEWLHLTYGPKVALDSLKHLTTKRQAKLGFYLRYAASLELELGNIDKAILLAEGLKGLMLDSTYTSHMKLRVEILKAQDSLQKAMALIDRVVKIDSNHLIAIALQREISEMLQTK